MVVLDGPLTAPHACLPAPQDALALELQSGPHGPKEQLVAAGEYGNALCIVTTGQVQRRQNHALSPAPQISRLNHGLCAKNQGLTAVSGGSAVVFGPRGRWFCPPWRQVVVLCEGHKRNLIMADDEEPCFGVTAALGGPEFASGAHAEPNSPNSLQSSEPPSSRLNPSPVV